MDPTFALVNQYGIAAVIGYLLAKDLGGYLLGRFFPARPPLAVPGVPPATPVSAPSPHPVLSWLLGAAAKAAGQPVPTDPTKLHPDVIAQLKAEAASLLVPPK